MIGLIIGGAVVAAVVGSGYLADKSGLTKKIIKSRHVKKIKPLLSQTMLTDKVEFYYNAKDFLKNYIYVEKDEETLNKVKIKLNKASAERIKINGIISGMSDDEFTLFVKEIEVDIYIIKYSNGKEPNLPFDIEFVSEYHNKSILSRDAEERYNEVAERVKEISNFKTIDDAEKFAKQLQSGCSIDKKISDAIEAKLLKANNQKQLSN